MKSHWNPILLIHLCVIFTGFCVSTVELSIGDRDHVARKARNVLLSGPLQRETFVLLYYVETPPFQIFFLIFENRGKIHKIYRLNHFLKSLDQWHQAHSHCHVPIATALHLPPMKLRAH